MQEFLTIKHNIEAELVEKKSKFIANLFYIENQKQAEDIIKQTKKNNTSCYKLHPLFHTFTF